MTHYYYNCLRDLVLKLPVLIGVLVDRSVNETLQGVLGSGENGIKKYREQGAWGQKD